MPTISQLESVLYISVLPSSKTICLIFPVETQTRVVPRQLCQSTIQKWVVVQGMSSWTKFLNTKTNPTPLSDPVSLSSFQSMGQLTESGRYVPSCSWLISWLWIQVSIFPVWEKCELNQFPMWKEFPISPILPGELESHLTWRLGDLNLSS